jgi:uncharacterized SAM-binding protein YcdF (DUF218 family)
MFFVLSKVLGFLLLPSNFLILLGLLGVVLLGTRFKRTGIRLAAVSIVLLAAAGFLPVGGLLARSLESRFPPWTPTQAAPDGIIVLGGAIKPVLSNARGAPQVGASAERLMAVAALARAYPKARVVYSGGNASVFGGPSEADYVLRLFESFGIAPERVTLERRSRNTAENAAYSKALIKPKAGEHWLLVTSAQHMPRAIGCFRKIGFPVEAYPVDWTTAPGFSLMSLAPPQFLTLRLHELDEAAHEWLGLTVYWLTGHTSAFLPGPVPVH